MFGAHDITKVEIDPIETPVEDTADLPADQNSHLALPENIEIFGETESFICQYHVDDETMITDEIYSIVNNGLKKLPLQHFQGTYQR